MSSLRFGQTLQYRVTPFGAKHGTDRDFLNNLGSRSSDGLHHIGEQDVFVTTMRNDLDEPLSVEIYTASGRASQTLKDEIERIRTSQSGTIYEITPGSALRNTEGYNDRDPFDAQEGKFAVVNGADVREFEALEPAKGKQLPNKVVVTSDDSCLDLYASCKNDPERSNDDLESMAEILDSRSKRLLVFDLQGECVGTTTQMGLLG
ncbi:MAG TPA: hypothetical protein V6C52_03855 [Coleofasciculaceae cyanobacterium]|jgi:hypothetical protein